MYQRNSVIKLTSVGLAYAHPINWFLINIVFMLNMSGYIVETTQKLLLAGALTVTKDVTSVIPRNKNCSGKMEVVLLRSVLIG